MRASSDTGSLGPHLPAVYRFAYLMTGEAAAAGTVLRLTVEHAARGGYADLRDEHRVKRFLFAEARRQCTAVQTSHAANESLELTTPAAPLAEAATPAEVIDTRALAQRFFILPEPERAALVLFYLYLFDPAELAETLEISGGELAPLLNHGRKLLGLSALSAVSPG